MVLGDVVEPGQPGGFVGKANIGVDPANHSCPAGEGRCYNETDVASPATCTLACDYDFLKTGAVAVIVCATQG